MSLIKSIFSFFYKTLYFSDFKPLYNESIRTFLLSCKSRFVQKITNYWMLSDLTFDVSNHRVQFFMFLQEKISAHNLWSKIVVFPLHYIIKLLQSQLNHLLSKGNTRWERGKWVCANPVLENPQNNYTVFPEMERQ